MGRIGDRFEKLKIEGKRAFIPYITAGDPDLQTTERILEELVLAGADVIELGVPFSDPIADGPVIQAASERALAGGTSVPVVLEIAEQIRRVLPNLVRREHVNNKAVAKMFGLHPRTMARRLAEEGVTLHGLVEDARFEVAKQLLIDTDLGLTEIAADLFYSDASAFARAFRRKIGETPGSWRKSGRREREATFHVSD